MNTVHKCDYASQPDIRLKCSQTWTEPAWVQVDVPAGVYRADTGDLYTFDAALVTCQECRRERPDKGSDTMRTALGLYAEACEKLGVHSEAARSWREAVPPWQVRADFETYSRLCVNRRCPSLERRPGNALNIEVGVPQPRCIARTPSHWNGASGVRWIASGGSPLVFGLCSLSGCPAARQPQEPTA